MTKIPTDWTTLVVKFQTAAVMPPPYAYFYTLQIEKKPSGLAIDYILQYLERDEIDEEAILEEGFTLNDDFGWKGDLPEVWREELTQLLNQTTLAADVKIKETDNYIEFLFDEGQSAGTFPTERKPWDYFLQELVQAIYEAAKKERAFELEYVRIDGDKKSTVQIEASFAKRLFTVQLNGLSAQKMDWKWSRQTMETIFQADFLVDDAEERHPEFSGKYLNVGDGLWYEFGETLVEPTPESKVLPKIEQLMEKVIREANTAKSA